MGSYIIVIGFHNDNIHFLTYNINILSNGWMVQDGGEKFFILRR
jgi:hypothetical protein